MATTAVSRRTTAEMSSRFCRGGDQVNVTARSVNLMRAIVFARIEQRRSSTSTDAPKAARCVIDCPPSTLSVRRMGLCHPGNVEVGRARRRSGRRCAAVLSLAAGNVGDKRLRRATPGSLRRGTLDVP